MRDYQLVCCACGAAYVDDGSRLDCANDHGAALLRTQYAQRAFSPGPADSVLRYRDWLPTAREIGTAARTGVYRSSALGSHLGLRRLWIAFSGWWPQRGATLPTGSFKDLEAVSVLRRIDSADARTLVISSAGNTARAFADLCSRNGIAALIVVPLDGWRDTMRALRVGPTVRVVAIADAGYDEAIGLARDVCTDDAFLLEGGVRNVARRDGMGTAMLAAVEAIGHLPEYYFQAVGSAAGALAAHEAALRLIADGRYGTVLPRLMLSQNAPFTPIHDAWQSRSAQLLDRPPGNTRPAGIDAFVLGNKAPPYSLPGGVRQALCASGGSTYAVTNEQLRNAGALFAELEGMPIEPAAAVAVASLVRAATAGVIDPAASVVLHITGGGRTAPQANDVARSAPTLVVRRGELATTAVDQARSLLR